MNEKTADINTFFKEVYNSEYDNKSFDTVYNNWYKEAQGKRGNISDLWFLGWFKANDIEMYDIKKQLLARYDAGEMNSEKYYEIFIINLQQHGYKHKKFPITRADYKGVKHY